MNRVWTVRWSTCMGKCMVYTSAHVLSKWFWQQKVFPDFLEGERQLRSVLPVFTLDWDLFSLVFFSFSISSDLKPGRIILTCLKAIFSLTLSFSSSPMNVNHRANIQGQLTLCRAKIKHFRVPFCFHFFYFFFSLKSCFWYKECYDAKVATADAVAVNLCFAGRFH